MNPQELVSSLMDQAQQSGATLEIDCVLGLEMDCCLAKGIPMEGGSIRFIDSDEPVLVCMGP